MEPFKPIKLDYNEYVITSGPQKGWKVQISVHLRTIKFDGLSPDGTPKFTLGLDNLSNPVPPAIEDADNR